MHTDDIGYFKYHGKKVGKGVFDARRASLALSSFDEIVRHFVKIEEPALEDVEFELPIEIREGSWEIAIGVAACSLIYTYMKETAKKAANDGLFETGLAKDSKEVFSYAIKAAIRLLQLIKSNKKSILELKQLVKSKISFTSGLTATDVRYITLCPDDLFENMSETIEHDCELEIVAYDNDSFKKINITSKEKTFLYRSPKTIEQEIVLPELKHNSRVSISGKITRINEEYNNFGLLYQDHHLSCKPKEGSLTKYKDIIFSNDNSCLLNIVKVIGTVNREGVKGSYKYQKPEIIFDMLYQDGFRQSNLI